jgi:hypothetical protein
VEPSLPADRNARFAEILCQVDAELDWRLLGRSYCHEGGEDFFDEASIEALRDSGLRLASDLVEALEAGGRGGGSSVYVGAGVFELVPILVERILLGREIDVFTLPGPEPEEIERALRLVAARTGEALPRFRMEAFVPPAERRYGHVWLVSVLTDPDHFPALHDELYERRGSELATGRGNPTEERGRARSLVEKLLRGHTSRGLFSTTEEELTIVEPVCRRLGLRLEVPERARLTGIVGDAVRICRVSRRGA